MKFNDSDFKLVFADLNLDKTYGIFRKPGAERRRATGSSAGPPACLFFRSLPSTC
jgi:hypothetical protein